MSPSRRIVRHLAQLWQVPLLLVSLALFAAAAYLLFDPQAGMSSQQKIQRARAFLKTDRPDAAVEPNPFCLRIGSILRDELAALGNADSPRRLAERTQRFDRIGQPDPVLAPTG